MVQINIYGMYIIWEVDKNNRLTWNNTCFGLISSNNSHTDDSFPIRNRAVPHWTIWSRNGSTLQTGCFLHDWHFLETKTRLRLDNFLDRHDLLHDPIRNNSTFPSFQTFPQNRMLMWRQRWHILYRYWHLHQWLLISFLMRYIKWWRMSCSYFLFSKKLIRTS